MAGISAFRKPSGPGRPSGSPSEEMWVWGRDQKELLHSPLTLSESPTDNQCLPEAARSIRSRRADGSVQSSNNRTPRAIKMPTMPEIKPKHRCPLRATTSPGSTPRAASSLAILVAEACQLLVAPFLTVLKNSNLVRIAFGDGKKCVRHRKLLRLSKQNRRVGQQPPGSLCYQRIDANWKVRVLRLPWSTSAQIDLRDERCAREETGQSDMPA